MKKLLFFLATVAFLAVYGPPEAEEQATVRIAGSLRQAEQGEYEKATATLDFVERWLDWTEAAEGVSDARREIAAMAAGRDEERGSGAAEESGAAAARSANGRYQSVSESEWHVVLALDADGGAGLEVLTWLPAPAEERVVDTVRHLGSWTQDGRRITLRYGGDTTVIEYFEALSFREFGCPGEGEGLRGVQSSRPDPVLVDVTLWRVEALRTVPDSC